MASPEEEAKAQIRQHKGAGLIHEAIAVAQQAIKRAPADLELLLLHADCLYLAGQAEAAIKHYQAITQQFPEGGDAYRCLGDIYTFQAKNKRAVEAYRQAINRNRQDLPAINSLANTLVSMNEHQRALACFRALLEVLPGNVAVLFNMIKPLCELCLWEEKAAVFQQLFPAITAQLQDPHSTPLSPFILNYSTDPLATSLRPQVAKHRANHLTNKVKPLAKLNNFTFPPKRQGHQQQQGRIKLGYLSPDFRKHPVGVLTSQMYQHHDRALFEVYAYSLASVNDEVTQTIRNGCDEFRPVFKLSAQDTAKQIYADGIDILIDLCGYTSHSFTEVLAMRPAPIQISYLGYLDTMGADFIDYLIADKSVVKPAEESYYTEKIIYLPQCFMVASPLDWVSAPMPRQQFNLPEDAFVYCCFNGPQKIDGAVFAVWMKLLNQVPQSVLWLLDNGCPDSQQRLRSLAEQAGVAPQRLHFRSKLPLQEHIASFQLADCFLDTFLYNAGATAVYANWMGLPVVTRPGHSILSRMCASINQANGMAELVCQDEHAYFNKALALATNPAELKALKQKLIRRRTSAGLFDTAQFVRHLEQAYADVFSVA